jgi:cytochrome c biogenesis protein CcmG/thiol:disulfide interchange protein DsbE
MSTTTAPSPPHPEPAEPPATARRGGLIVGSIVVVLTLGIGTVLLLALLPGDGLPRNPVGVEAPTFALQTLDGELLSLADLAGDPVVVTFWASWCGTCKQDMPTIQHLADRWAPRGVAVVGVVIDDELGAAREVAAEHQLRYPSVFDTDGEVARAYSVTGTPETYLIGADGRVAAMWIGPLPTAELELQLAVATEAGG